MGLSTKYQIAEHTEKQAKKLGVEVEISTVKGKKLDVFKDGKKVASIGALGYGDYPTFLAMEKRGEVDKGFAAKRRKAYKARHEKNRHVKGSAGYYADRLLW